LFVVTLSGQLSLPFWGGYLPHHAGPRLLAISRALAWTRLPLLAALAIHEAHHQRPKTPSFTLAGLVDQPNSRGFRATPRIVSDVLEPSSVV
jgi:hypothetical protein